MTDQLVNEFVKRALNSGISREKVAALVSRAQEIEYRNYPQKTAQLQLSNVVSNLLSEAGFDKNASSVAYARGILKEALDNQLSQQDSIKVARLTLAKTRDNLQLANKLASVSQTAELAEYAEGFIKAATERGYTQEYATRYVINLIENEKRAAGPGGPPMPPGGAPPPLPPPGGMPPGGAGGMPPGGADDMFKQPMPDPSSLGGGMPGGPGSAGMGGPGGPDGQQLDPQLIEQLLALISGGHGGQGGGQDPAAGLAQQ